jgi:Cft2 family RNA processing exonuclease
LIVVVSLGVEAVEVDREENKVTVTGDFKMEKLL